MRIGDSPKQLRGLSLAASKWWRTFQCQRVRASCSNLLTSSEGFETERRLATARVETSVRCAIHFATLGANEIASLVDQSYGDFEV
jgi:hypothetical protein